MSFIFDASKRTRILAAMIVDVNPTGSTIEVAIDGTWYPATWLDSPVQSGAKWTQTARTVAYFAGPNATANGATVLALGKHPTMTRVTQGSDVLTMPSDTIDVR